ncbi:MAG: hypothetical protein M0022_04510 [Desulfobacteraceae bacterium]|nr:hypothetical protein [Desulfobacteraceae bacterium]
MEHAEKETFQLLPGAAVLTESCRAFLRKSEKAAMQWRYEAALERFNLVYGARFREYLGAHHIP